jgi:hypothetical protein
MRAPALLVLVMLAVLGAPPMASAAGPNTLSAPQASPSSGSADTTFAFAVSYVGSSPALVTVTVAGRTLPMILVSGTPTDGRWRATTTALPPGNWPTAFHAIVDADKDATVDGPTLAIASILDDPTNPTSEDPGGPDPSSGAPSPDAAANPSPPPVAPVTPDAPAAPASPGAPHSTDPGTNLPVQSPTPEVAGPMHAPAGDQPGNPDLPDPSLDPAASADLLDGPVVATPPAAAPIGVLASSPDPDPVHADDSGSISQVGAAIAIGGMAVLALIAGLLVIVGRRRRLQPDAAAPAYRARALRPDTVDVRVAAALHRRTLRRAKVRLEEDPIVASIDPIRPADPAEPPPTPRPRRRR